MLNILKKRCQINNYNLCPPSGGGGKNLQNQLEQVLMMKSGEFSAGGRTDGKFDGQLPAPDGILNQSHLSQNYGNPNFMPPQGHMSRGPGDT